MKDFSKLCTPAKVYFGIAAIATLFDLFNGVSIMLAFWKLVFAFIWTFILGGLCDKGYKSISWFLVLLPYILMFLASLNIYHVTDEQRQFMRSIQLQGAFGQEAFTEGLSSMGVPNAAQQAAAAAAAALSEQETPTMNMADKALKTKLPDNATQSDKNNLSSNQNRLFQDKQDYNNNSASSTAVNRLQKLTTIQLTTSKIRNILKKYNINL